MIIGVTDCGMKYAVRRSGSSVAYCALSIKCGTRDEDGYHSGIAHFTEHTLFKGTARKSASAVNSYLDRLGRGIEPVLKPLGLNWKAGVALVAGIPAKEVIASTLGVLYNSEEEGEGLSEKLAASGDFTTPSAVAFMIFILLYCPCIATISAISNEAGSWKWGAFSIIYNTAIAWIVAFIGMLVTSLII